MQSEKVINAVLSTVKEGKAERLTPLIDERVAELRGTELVVKTMRALGSSIRLRRTFYIVFGEADVVQEREYVDPHAPYTVLSTYRITPHSPAVIIEPRLDVVRENGYVVTVGGTYYVYYDHAWFLVRLNKKEDAG